MHRICMLWVNPEAIVHWSNISKVRTVSFFIHSVLKICRTRDRFAYNFLQNHPNSTLRYSKCIAYVCCEWIRKELSIGGIYQKLEPAVLRNCCRCEKSNFFDLLILAPDHLTALIGNIWVIYSFWNERNCWIYCQTVDIREIYLLYWGTSNLTCWQSWWSQLSTWYRFLYQI